MSAKSARRRQTGRTQLADLGRHRTEKVLGLLHVRERLARAAAEYEAHDFEDALEVFQQQLDIETAIKRLDPDLYEARWAEWLELDVALAHTSETPHPECGHCRLLRQRANDLPPGPLPQAG